MSQTNPSTRLQLTLLAAAFLFPSLAQAQEPKKATAPADEVKALIDKLTEIDQQDTGYSGSNSGSSFLPLGQSNTGAMLLFQRPNKSSESLKSLVDLGLKAIPALIEHLKDDRPTKIKVTNGFGGFFGIGHDEDEKANAEDEAARSYTIKVGDLCYVAIGQIVNRPYTAVKYIPSGNVSITSAPRSKKLRDELSKEWGSLTPEKHRDSLARDFDSLQNNVRNGAALRLAYYYPAALEPLVLKQLARPMYDNGKIFYLIRDQLYPAKTAKERKEIVEKFVGQHGEIARDGIQWSLFDDLDTQEADEENRITPKLNDRYRARECLIDLFGLPANVKSKDRPASEPLNQTDQAAFVHTLRYDRSEKIDHAVRDILVKTDFGYMASGCMNRLAGRGYDTEMEGYLRRRLAEAKDDRERKFFSEYQSKLGWTRLHAAVDLGVTRIVEAAINEKSPVDKQARDGRTALHLAAAAGQTTSVELLLKAKANPNIKDDAKQLPIQLAAREDHIAIVRLLLESKSEITDNIFLVIVSGDQRRLASILKEKPGLVKSRNRQRLTLKQANAAAAKVLTVCFAAMRTASGLSGGTASGLRFQRLSY